MEPKTLAEISGLASVHPDLPVQEKLARNERLERWAVALERQQDRYLRPLERVEFVTPQERKALRSDNSPLTVAFEDKTLRADGLQGDRLGDAAAYFGLSNEQAHLIVCDCHYVGTMRAGEVARRVRAAQKSAPHDSKVSFAGLCMAGLVAAPIVALVISAL